MTAIVLVRADIADAGAMRQVFETHDPDAVMHLAAESHVDRSIDGPADFVQTNVVGTFILLEAARRHYEAMAADRKAAFRFHHVSTDEVFGALAHDDPPFTETTPYDPRSPYSATKAASDHLVRAWSHTYKLPTIVSNTCNNYGPWQFPEKLIPLVTLNALEGKELPVYGDGSNMRDWLFVEDHAEALVRVVEQGVPGETYAIGGRQPRTNLQVVKAICAHLDKRVPDPAGPRERLIRFVTDRPGHDFRYEIDPSRSEQALDWKAPHDFERGLARTIDWYLDNRDWWEALRAARYAGQRLGTSTERNAAASKETSSMKGILLAGGSGTRLHPMTLAASKQLLPVYDKPMVYYPLSTLMLAGIKDIMLISTPEDLPQFRRLLGDGSRFGVRFEYAVQPKPGRHRAGLPDRPRLAGRGSLCPGARRQSDPCRPSFNIAAAARPRGRLAPPYSPIRCEIRNAMASWHSILNGKAVEVVEKPAAPTSNWAITGLYFYDKQVSDIAPRIKPSPRGELEITDLNRVYLEMGTLQVEKLSRGCAWLDAGTPDSLLQAATFVQTIQSRTGMLVGCPEEVAFRMGLIDADRLRHHATHLGKTELGRVLMELAEGEME